MSYTNTNLPKLRITRHPIDPQTGRPARLPTSSTPSAPPMRVVRLRKPANHDYLQTRDDVRAPAPASVKPPTQVAARQLRIVRLPRNMAIQEIYERECDAEDEDRALEGLEPLPRREFSDPGYVVVKTSKPQRQLATSAEETSADPFVEPKKAPVVRPFWRARGVPTTIDRLKVAYATDPVLGPVYGPHVAWMEEEKRRRLSQPTPSPPMPIPACRQPPPPPRQPSPTPRRRGPVPVPVTTRHDDTPSNIYEAPTASSVASSFSQFVPERRTSLSPPLSESSGYLTSTQSVEVRTSEFDTFDNFTSIGHGLSATTSSTASSRSSSHRSASLRSASSQATVSSVSDPASDSQEEDGYDSDNSDDLWLEAMLIYMERLPPGDPAIGQVRAEIRRLYPNSSKALEVECTDLASHESDSDDGVEIGDNSAWERQYEYYKQEMPAQPSQVESRPVSRCSSFSEAPDAECTDPASEYQSEVDNQSEDDNADDADETDDKSTWQSEYEAYRRDREASRREVEDNSDDNDDTISSVSTCHLCGDLTCRDPHCMRRQGRLAYPKIEITPERQAEIDNDPMFEEFEREASARYLADQAERARTAAPLPPPRLRQPEARIPTIPDNHDSEDDTTGSLTARLNSFTGSLRVMLGAIRARIFGAWSFGRSR
ncbi:hypothetical protein H2201_000790 [Coniosporium apollinis]|uniref:Uncharacterized protein n=1 Tax=Coniosporium apollinis TaxID=61459 RepID=A0ABQ9P2Y4_9PEZI|nr:hypothetical protein H2201_000790 [Coniosporium apollinis]